MSVELATLKHFGPDKRNIPIKSKNGTYVVPHSLAKLMDSQINRWRTEYIPNLSRAQSTLPDFIIGSNRNFPSLKYLPGRQPLTEDWRTLCEKTVSKRFELMVEQKLISGQLKPVYQAAFDLVFKESVQLKLPMLAMEWVVGNLFRGIGREDEGIDLLKRQKEQARTQILNIRSSIEGRCASSINYLKPSFEAAILGNDLGFIAENNLPGLIDNFQKSSELPYTWHQPLDFYKDDIYLAIDYLNQSKRKIAYLLDNAGESLVDLFVIQFLLLRGHNIKVIARSKPALNDETAAELKAFAVKNQDDLGLINMSVPIVPGSPVPGLDLTSMDEAGKEALKWADLIIAKGEGNMMGLPPEYNYNKDIFYLFKSKSPLFSQGIGQFTGVGTDPTAGQAVAWLKLAGK